MTFEEFVAAVRQQIEEKGISPDTEVRYIDVSGFALRHLSVHLDEEAALEIVT